MSPLSTVIPTICGTWQLVSSKPYGVGKAKSLKLLSTNTTIQMMAAKFYEQDATIDVIQEAGEVAMILIYGGSTNKGIDTLRYKEFQRKISIATSFMNPQEIPPTSAALQFNSQRVYFQVQSWLGFSLDDCDWGWVMKHDMLWPRLNNIEAAPKDLLQIIKCGGKGDCDSQRCTCRKNCILCSFACKNCKGTTCRNAEVDDILVEDDESVC
ncbi:hypothetical protein DAPPUDRAFT_103743 [Daphnia pulex]|uniref:Tesmin/TSO1-like CXC domain-containing protein n=1 Tax=Daphnia pulex TaxID=6669 RepID=E9GK15_DAPPU|nr:hypothetical protein DAPPUDRAFT_103743 [Daphnia pulex]|eukprot:EFX80231.1 hypothetical protein DAPPUDRAFT_103743 [Daphnia pulex]